MNLLLDQKIKEFKKAIDIYHKNIFYNKFGIVVSIAVILLQVVTVYNLYMLFDSAIDLSFNGLLLSFFLAYVITDFLNGLIHMYMDNNTYYDSFFGPFIAAFHLHHKQPLYKKQNPIKIYFFESGAKLWLPFYLLLVIYMQNYVDLPFGIIFFLVNIGILSSVAEVSHYWCHNANNSNVVISFLQKYRILLSKNHHKHHHVSDNINYAFLNGMTDSLINIIAFYLYKGYKNYADLHVLAYKGLQTNNRIV